MRLVTFTPPDGPPRAGVLLGDSVVDLAAAAGLVIEDTEHLRWDMLSLLCGDQPEVNLSTAAEIVAAVAQFVGSDARDGALQIGGTAMLLPLDQVRLLAPLPR
ncbi:MAG: DUF2437 domain-containing protein, partial [Oscillochloris sp.]|nr:DUF2437 domain-containing protein [Oscillochloris sp.]